MRWIPFDSGASLGTPGSEGGQIVRDEEHDRGARITLEKGGYTAPFAITCGIYGWMVHTRFFEDAAQASTEFDGMKTVLSEILDALPVTEDAEEGDEDPRVSKAINAFLERFP